MAKNRTEYAPHAVSPPGATLEDMLEEHGLTQEALALRVGLAEKTVNHIITGSQVLTPETALKLEGVFGVPAHFWNSRERVYRDFLAQREERERSRKQVDWFRKFRARGMPYAAGVPLSGNLLANQ